VPPAKLAAKALFKFKPQSSAILVCYGAQEISALVFTNFSNSGNLEAGNNLNLSGVSIINSGKLLSLGSSASFNINLSNNLTNFGSVLSNNSLALTANNFTQNNAAITQAKAAAINLSGNLDNQDTAKIIADDLSIKADTLSNAGGIFQVGSAYLTQFIIQKDILNSGEIYSAANNFTLQSNLSNISNSSKITHIGTGLFNLNSANYLSNNLGAQLLSNASINIQSAVLNNAGNIWNTGNFIAIFSNFANSGNLETQGNFSLTGQNLINNNKIISLNSSGLSNINLSYGDLDNYGILGGLSSINIVAQNLNNFSQISAQQNLLLNIANQVHNVSGTIGAGASLDLQASTLQQNEATLQAGYLNIHDINSLINQAGSNILGKNINIATNYFDNAGQIAQLLNSGNNSFNLSSNSYFNNSGTLHANAQNFTINTSYANLKQFWYYQSWRFWSIKFTKLIQFN
jgi:filamentous hemagglutinin